MCSCTYIRYFRKYKRSTLSRLTKFLDAAQRGDEKCTQNLGGNSEGKMQLELPKHGQIFGQNILLNSTALKRSERDCFASKNESVTSS
jgi:hypothetical protein